MIWSIIKKVSYNLLCKGSDRQTNQKFWSFLQKFCQIWSVVIYILEQSFSQNSVRQHGAPEWIQRHSYILDYFNPNVRDLLESIDFDYAPIPEEWVASGIEVLVHRCDGAEFLSQARKAVGPVMNQSYDWTNVRHYHQNYRGLNFVISRISHPLNYAVWYQQMTNGAQKSIRWLKIKVGQYMKNGKET